MVLLKMIVVFITAWIGTMWPYSWTSLILTLSLAVLCLSLAYEQRGKVGQVRIRGHRTA